MHKAIFTYTAWTHFAMIIHVFGDKRRLSEHDTFLQLFEDKLRLSEQYNTHFSIIFHSLLTETVTVTSLSNGLNSKHVY